MDEKQNGKQPEVSAGMKAINFVTEWGGMIALVIMTIIVNFTVVTRYFFSYTPGWGESGALLCMVWFGFLSMALGVRDRQHISITILDNFLNKKALLKLDYFQQTAIFLFGIFLIKEGFVLCEVGLHNNMPGLGLSSTYQYAAVPYVGLAMCIYSAAHIINNARGKGLTAKKEEEEL